MQQYCSCLNTECQRKIINKCRKKWWGKKSTWVSYIYRFRKKKFSSGIISPPNASLLTEEVNFSKSVEGPDSLEGNKVQAEDRRYARKKNSWWIKRAFLPVTFPFLGTLKNTSSVSTACTQGNTERSFKYT